MCNHVHSQEVEVSLSDWELGVASGLNEMKEKLSLCEVRQTCFVLDGETKSFGTGLIVNER